MNKLIAAMLLSLATLTVNAAIVAKVEFKDGGVLFFTNEQRKCPEGWKATEYVYPYGKQIGGCYAPTPRGLYVKDEEGDDGIIPYEALKKPTEVVK